MSIRKLITLAGLALAVVAIGPAPALANAGGTDRPAKGSGSGIVSINVQTGAITVDAAGVGTGVGEYTSHIDATLAFTPEGTVRAPGTQTVVADNGDQLTGTVIITGPAPTTGVHQTMSVMTVTGGTGRFADATGTLTTTSVTTPFSFDGVTLLESTEFTYTGEVSY